jgi:NAD-dependent oxidoreductase involved in siderophore biosynthesis
VSTAFPYVLSALDGIDRHLPRIGQYVQRARALASRFGDICRVNPTVPHTNAFQVLLNGTPAELVERQRSFARSESVWLFNAFTETQLPQISMAEVVIGSAADLYTDGEACGWVSSFVK